MTMRTIIKLHMGHGTPDPQYISAEEYEYRCLSRGSTDGTLTGIEDTIDRDELSAEFQRTIADRKEREARFKDQLSKRQADRRKRVSEMIEQFAAEEEKEKAYYGSVFADEQEECRRDYADRVKFERKRAERRKREAEEQARAEMRQKRIEARERTKATADAG